MIKILILCLTLVSALFSMTYEKAKKIEKEHGTLKAVSHYKELAKKNNPDAIFELAVIYSQGKIFRKNINKTHNLLKKASEIGHTKASFYLGKLYLSKKSDYYDLTKAYNSFAKAANENYAPAQNMIGQFLVKGIVIDKDYVKAVKLFEKASKQKYVDAQCNLAFMYANGMGVFTNLGRAHAFAKDGYKQGNKRCVKVWKDYNLHKYPEDKAWKFNFYTKPE